MLFSLWYPVSRGRVLERDISPFVLRHLMGSTVHMPTVLKRLVESDGCDTSTPSQDDTKPFAHSLGAAFPSSNATASTAAATSTTDTSSAEAVDARDAGDERDLRDTTGVHVAPPSNTTASTTAPPLKRICGPSPVVCLHPHSRLANAKAPDPGNDVMLCWKGDTRK